MTQSTEASSASPDYSPAIKREFKVGDRVKVIEWFDWQRDYYKDEPEDSAKIVTKGTDSGGDVRLKGSPNDCFFQADSLELAEATFTPDPDKSYAENQAAWIKHHGLEVGSEVKVVRKFKDDEDGYNGSSRDTYIGTVACIALTQGTDGIKLKDSTWFPYFALEPVK